MRTNNTSDILAGIDLGTSSLKTALIQPDGRLLAVAAGEYPVDTPRLGWAEQDPQLWYQTAIATFRQALAQAQAAPGAVRAIGLSGQMHGPVCLDASGKPLRPAIIWADQRSRPQVEQVQSRLGVEQLGRWTANPLAAGFMLVTWLWLLENETDLASRTKTLLLPKDYLRYRLTGELGTEPSDASATSLFSPQERAWSMPLLESLGIDPFLLPPVYPSGTVAGGLARDAADDLGLPAGIPVVYGASDQACQAVGHGVIDPGQVSSTIGTGGQLLAPTATPAYDPQLRLHLFCHAMPERWHLEAATLAAGLALRWLRDQVLKGSTYQQLADLAGSVPPGAEGLFFLPYLAGERTPHLDPAARGAFVGLTLRHNRAHLARAVMEGAVFALKQGLDLISDMGVTTERVIASGGATSHPLWLQLQADIYNRPLHRTLTVEAAAVGAALLAGVGVGLYPDVRSACRRVVRLRPEVVEPQPERVEFYARAFETYARLYPELADHFHA